ncbi:MAG: hypothetical protein ACI9BW_004044 [Gammaproteobacteria bacterium]|jgi:hypothetical protein
MAHNRNKRLNSLAFLRARVIFDDLASHEHDWTATIQFADDAASKPVGTLQVAEITRPKLSSSSARRSAVKVKMFSAVSRPRMWRVRDRRPWFPLRLRLRPGNQRWHEADEKQGHADPTRPDPKRGVRI